MPEPSAVGARAYRVYLYLTGGSAFLRQTISTVLAVYYVTVVGLNPLEIMLAGTVREATCFLLEVPTGVIADTFSRKWAVIIGLVLVGLAFAVQGVAPLFSAILAAECLRGVGETLVNGAENAWIAGEVGEARVRHVFIRGAQVGHVAAVAGSLASVAVASVQLNAPIWLGGLTLIVLAASLIGTMRETAFERHAGPSPLAAFGGAFGASLRTLRLRPVLLVVLGIAGFHGAMSAGFDRLWEAHLLTTIGLPPLGALAPVVWFGLIGAVSRLLAVVAAEVVRRGDESRDGMRRTLMIVDGALVVALAGFALAGNFAVAIVIYLAAAVLREVESPLYDAWLARQVDARVRATVLSMSSQLDALGQVTGGPLIGLIGTLAGLRAAMGASAVWLLPTLALYGLVGRGHARDAVSHAQPSAD